MLDPPADGAWNMALDEALLDSASCGATAGCLRFYLWQQPTLSLGYFQHYADRLGHSASQDCAVVRRVTGGGAILHDVELTYSLTVPVRAHVSAGLREFYDVMHGTLIDELASRGVPAVRCVRACDSQRPEEPFLCFQRRCDGDVLTAGYKIAGSAQRRHRGGLLQHGSVLLGCSVAAPELPGLRELTDLQLEPQALARRWAARIADRLGVKLVSETATDGEGLLARSYQRAKFGDSSWTRRR